MSFLDLIKKGVVEEFTGSISTSELIFSVLTAIVCASIINFVYCKTYMGVSYTKTFSLSIILLSMVTSLVIRTINSNLALSLGMVGALSIVRFRTAVKDPLDTIFMFWSITIGIMSGAGLYLTTVLATIILGILYFVFHMFIFKSEKKYLLVLRVESSIASDIAKNMNRQKKCVLKTEIVNNNIVEFTYEVINKDIANEILKWNDNLEIQSINLININ